MLKKGNIYLLPGYLVIISRRKQERSDLCYHCLVNDDPNNLS